MNTTPHRYEVCIAARGLLEIPDVAGVQLSCSDGSVWLTLDNDTRDIVLEPGDVFFSTEHRRALLYAFGPATVALRPPAGVRAAAHAPRISFMPGVA
jgi:hypothetical protein